MLRVGNCHLSLASFCIVGFPGGRTLKQFDQFGHRAGGRASIRTFIKALKPEGLIRMGAVSINTSSAVRRRPGIRNLQNTRLIVQSFIG
jgi:hypothetical protein